MLEVPERWCPCWNQLHRSRDNSGHIARCLSWLSAWCRCRHHCHSRSTSCGTRQHWPTPRSAWDHDSPQWKELGLARGSGTLRWLSQVLDQYEPHTHPARVASSNHSLPICHRCHGTQRLPPSWRWLDSSAQCSSPHWDKVEKCSIRQRLLFYILSVFCVCGSEWVSKR